MHIITLTKQPTISSTAAAPASIGDGAPEILPPQLSEGEILRGISTAMIFAGIRALGEWQARKDAGEVISQADVVCAVYAAMRRQAE